MSAHKGKVAEIQLDSGGGAAAWITCPQQAIPAPGQYLLARDHDPVLPVPLFPGVFSDQGFLAAPPVPVTWAPGTSLKLRGPLGNGFQIPVRIQSLALVGMGDTIARLLPLTTQALQVNLAIALFADTPLPTLPLALEAHPLSALPEASSWADFMVVDLPLEALPKFRETLGLSPERHLPCRGQALIVAPMPCGGLADCAVCAVPARRSWKLACKDGPVFNLDELEW